MEATTQQEQLPAVAAVDEQPIDEGTRMKSIIEEVKRKKYVPQDWKDVSQHPSYSKFEVPYYMKCRDRYHKSKQRYEHQFQHEINHIINQQSSAFEAARLIRHLSITTLWPPWHNRHEIYETDHHFFQLTPKQRRRYNIILSTNFQ